MRSVINFLTRPFVGDQTTARQAFQQYNGYAYTGINGDAGFTVLGQIRAEYPAGIAPGPTHKLNDPSVTGNDSSNIALQPLTDDRSI